MSVTQEMLMQVLALSPEQIAALPEAERMAIQNLVRNVFSFSYRMNEKGQRDRMDIDMDLCFFSGRNSWVFWGLNEVYIRDRLGAPSHWTLDTGHWTLEGVAAR